MRNMLLKTAMAALVLSSPLAATEALAKYKVKDMKFHFVQGPYEDLPVMEMKFEGGAWKWANSGKHFKPRLKVFFKANRKSKASVHLEGYGKLWETPAGYKTKKLEDLVSIGVGKSLLSKYKNSAVAICDVFGGSKKVVRDMDLQAKMYVENANRYDGLKAKNGFFHAKVVCLSKGPTRNPDPAKQTSSSSDSSSGHSTLKLVLKEVKLYTIPAKPRCGKPVKMVAEFRTNRPGKVNFLYVRGDGEKQSASVTTTKGGKGYVKRWAKNYKFNKTENRKYVISVPDHNIGTKWVPLKVNCSSGATTLSN